ncbi:MAG TPA: Calx-beta domain-containing protein [Acidimicrobiia bacterium]|nr:Calx-beta domain-containing protein [Acidimicrobiia bacterium]
MRRLSLVRCLAAFPLAVALAFFGLGLDWLVTSGGSSSVGASSVIGNPFGPPGARCGALTELKLPGNGWACSHGADPAPPGVDIKHRFDSTRLRTGLLLPDQNVDQRTAAAQNPNAHCFGDGVSGPRVQAIYARASDHTDQYPTVIPSIRKWAAEADAVFNQSAGESGGIRHVRWQTDSTCQPTVDHVILSPTGDDTLANTIAELSSLGYDRPDRKYVVWVDANELCGISSYYEDDRMSGDNFNNGNAIAPPTVSRIDNGCWGLGSQGESIEAHELMHALGSVMPTAPHSTVLGHCTDDADRMCYADGSAVTVSMICASGEEALFDCHKDDYFSAAANPGGYLASHWNTARSEFLATSDGDPAVSIGGGPTLPEGDLDTKPFTFPVTLAVPSNLPASVNWSTSDGTAVAGQDYRAASGTITFAPGETQKIITVNVIGDFDREPDEWFNVNLSAPVNAQLGGSVTSRGTILNDDPKGQGYWLVASDGGIFSYADSRFHGSTGDIRLNKPIVGMAPTPSGLGYGLVASDGGIFSFGDATFHGSTGGIHLAEPIVGMAPTPSGTGYWLVAADGGVFAFDAPSLGSAAGRSRATTVAIAPTGTGEGYWVVNSDGQVFSFGDAQPFGPTPRLQQPIVGAAAAPSGRGLWLVARDGGIFTFGEAAFHGSTGGIKLNQPIVGMARTPSGDGYWLVAQDGGIFAFGDAGFFGSTGNIRLNKPINGMGALPHPLD